MTQNLDFLQLFIQGTWIALAKLDLFHNEDLARLHIAHFIHSSKGALAHFLLHFKIWELTIRLFESQLCTMCQILYGTKDSTALSFILWSITCDSHLF